MGVILFLSDRNNAYTCKLRPLWSGICNDIKNAYPTIKFIQYTNWSHDKDTLPKSFENATLKMNIERVQCSFFYWFPMIVYFPGETWEQTLNNGSVDLKHQTYVMNGVFDDHKGLQCVIKYNLLKPDHYLDWLRSVVPVP
jgi:hypothetical protein